MTDDVRSPAGRVGRGGGMDGGCPAANRLVAGGTAGALRKQPPRDAQQAGVRAPKETRPSLPPSCPAIHHPPVESTRPAHHSPQPTHTTTHA